MGQNSLSIHEEQLERVCRKKLYELQGKIGFLVQFGIEYVLINIKELESRKFFLSSRMHMRDLS